MLRCADSDTQLASTNSTMLLNPALDAEALGYGLL
jgi:hypothetical protein